MLFFVSTIAEIKDAIRELPDEHLATLRACLPSMTPLCGIARLSRTFSRVASTSWLTKPSATGVRGVVPTCEPPRDLEGSGRVIGVCPSMSSVWPNAITVELTIPKGGAAGVISSAGAFSAGWSFYVKDGKPNSRYTGFDLSDIAIPPTIPLSAGKVTLKPEFTPDGSREGAGTLKLFVDGKPGPGECQIKRTFFRHGPEPFEDGRALDHTRLAAYKTPFAFTGTIDKITFELTGK